MVQDISDTTTKQAQTASNIQHWIASQVADQLGVQPDEIDPTVPLESYGLDSAQAMSIMTKAEALIGNPLSPTLLWHYPTIELLAERLAEDFAEDGSEFVEI